MNHYKAISQSVPLGSSSGPLGSGYGRGEEHAEVMRSLDQSQQEIEKEMSLLDEMLQVGACVGGGIFLFVWLIY